MGLLEWRRRHPRGPLRSPRGLEGCFWRVVQDLLLHQSGHVPTGAPRGGGGVEGTKECWGRSQPVCCQQAHLGGVGRHRAVPGRWGSPAPGAWSSCLQNGLFAVVEAGTSYRGTECSWRGPRPLLVDSAGPRGLAWLPACNLILADPLGLAAVCATVLTVLLRRLNI